MLLRRRWAPDLRLEARFVLNLAAGAAASTFYSLTYQGRACDPIIPEPSAVVYVISMQQPAFAGSWGSG